MFEENEDLVQETENTVEQPAEEVVEDVVEETEGETETTEEQEKVYTEDEFNQRLDDLLAKKLARKTAKLEKEYKKKYSKLENVLNAGLGTSNVEEATQQLTDFYKEQGVDIPTTEATFSEREIDVLAKAEADDIISLGYDEIKDESDRLAKIGVDNMSPRDKKLFSYLATERKRIEEEKELNSIGVNKDMLNDEEFNKFRDNLNPELSLKDQYEMYLKLKPKKQTKKIGSMKNGATAKVKDYYSPDEIERLTDEELDNPEVWEAERKSMTGRA